MSHERIPFVWRFRRSVAMGITGAIVCATLLMTAVGPAAADSTYSVYGTGDYGLNVRWGPGTDNPIAMNLSEGSPVDIVCQRKNLERVPADGGSTVWDEIALDRYGLPNYVAWVADYWVSTPAFDDYSPGVAHCFGE